MIALIQAGLNLVWQTLRGRAGAALPTARRNPRHLMVALPHHVTATALQPEEKSGGLSSANFQHAFVGIEIPVITTWLIAPTVA
jgi:hypothetical protein